MTEPTPPIDPAGPLAWLNDLAAPTPGSGAPQASDPVVYRGAISIPRAAPPAVGGGSFRVDRERAPEAIRDLEEALRELRVLRLDAAMLGKVAPPSRDEVSRDAAAVLATAAVGGRGSLVSALDAGVLRLEQLIESLREELKEYDRSDASSRLSFSDNARD